MINRTPSAYIEFKIPEEVWSGVKVEYSHLKRFGCVAYVHSVQDKMSPRALKGIFMGYPQGTKGYRLWLIEEGKSTISRNVVFNEKMLYKEYKGKGVASDAKAKKVTFKADLIQGPTRKNYIFEVGSSSESGNTSEGGVTSSQRRNSDSEESEEESEGQEESLDGYLLARDHVRRQTKPSAMFESGDFVAYALTCADDIVTNEPKSLAEAKRSKDWDKWNASMKEEKASLDKNHTWDIVDRPLRQRVIGCKWIHKLKKGIPGVEDPRYKSRLVAKGFTQVEGVDYNEIFAPVVKHVSIRIILSYVVNVDAELEQMDVKTAFLHGNLDETIYMEQPEGFIKKGDEGKVCLLRKSLYGLKQSPRQWNLRFDSFIKTLGFIRCVKDHCVYMKKLKTGDCIYLLLYVDDMLIAAKNKKNIQVLKKSLSTEFEMKDLGAASRILGMDIVRDREKGLLKLTQNRYIGQVLKTFGMEFCKPVITPTNSQFKLKSLTDKEWLIEMKVMDSVPYASAVGSLMYAMVGSRPDLAFAVGLVSRFMSKPSREHWEAVKWILRYLQGAKDVCLTFKRAGSFDVEGFCDSDYSTDLDKRRSVTGYVFKVGGNTVSWRSTLQHVVALSTTEAEYMALSEATKEGLWLREFCDELGFDSEFFNLHCDSQSAICLAKNPVHHDRTKHIARKIHFIRDIIEMGLVKVLKIHTSLNPADMLTKTLPGSAFEKCLKTLGIVA